MQKKNHAGILQGAALLILLRLFAFFCCGAPYTAAYARGMLTAALMQAAAILPLLKYPQTADLPPAILRLYRIYAIGWGARLTVLFRSLCRQLLLPRGQCGGLLILLTVMLFYTVPQNHRAAERAAGLLLPAFAAAFLLLPVSGLQSVRGISLFMPDSAAQGFLREWQFSGELPLIFLLRCSQEQQTACRSAVIWAVGRCVFLPLLVLFGTMQNGRLLRWEGNPFFLLLARTPLSDAIRTDGLWMLLVFACGGLCITCCLQAAKRETCTGFRGYAGIFLPYALAFAALSLLPAADRILTAAAILLGIALPWGRLVYAHFGKSSPQRSAAA